MYNLLKGGKAPFKFMMIYICTNFNGFKFFGLSVQNGKLYDFQIFPTLWEPTCSCGNCFVPLPPCMPPGFLPEQNRKEGAFTFNNKNIKQTIEPWNDLNKGIEDNKLFIYWINHVCNGYIVKV